MFQSPMINFEIAELRRMEALDRLDLSSHPQGRKSGFGIKALGDFLRARRSPASKAALPPIKPAIEQPAS